MADITSSSSSAKATSKKRSKKESTAVAATASEPAPPVTGGGNGTLDNEDKTNGDGPYESPYVRDLQRNIRNVTKKLAAMQKVDSIVAENPGVGLDDLVAARKINADQKAQAQKKPALQAQLAQYEEQISSYKKVEEDYQAQAAKAREKIENSHQVALESLRTTILEDAKLEAVKATRSHLLTLSTFLRAAAARRQVEDDTSEESKAFEGLLLLLYGGDITAVNAAEKLINGSDDGVVSTEGQKLNVSYGRVRKLSGEVAPTIGDEVPTVESAESTSDTLVNGTSSTGGATDPTIAHAGLNEETTDLPAIQPEATTIIEQGDVGDGAANAAATTSWDNNAPLTSADPMAESWVSVPRPADETEKDTTPIIAAEINQSSTDNDANGWDEAENAGTASTGAWADEAPPPADDGFHEVQRHRGRGRGGAGFDGRGGRGGRGRGGHRGESRGGRGRGGRGGRGRGDGPTT